MKYIRVILAVMTVCIAGYIIFGEILMPANSPVNRNLCETLPGDGWYIVEEDGSRTPFEVPGRADSDIVIETTLPAQLDRDASVLCFRGMDMKIYIGGELRTVYEIEDYPLLGDRSAECYVMTSLYPEDAGKTLTVYYSYNSGVVYEVYIGTRLGILTHLFKLYGAELLVGLAILLLGLISFVASVVYRIIHRKYLEMQHLSMGVLFGAFWVLSNSVFRQMFTRNVSVMSDIPFLMVMLMPLPFLVFINSLQESRYVKVITFTAVLEIISFVICMTLFVTGRVTLLNSFPLAAGCALISILVIGGTIIEDTTRHLVRSYRYIAVGFAFLGIAAFVQIMMYQFAHNGVFSGLFMSIGLFGFLIFSIIHTIKQLIGIRVEANEAMHANKVKDDFLASMSHEIRTPLNGILGMDEMIIRDTKESRIKRYALDIKSAGNTLLSLINDILDFSKIQSGDFEIIDMDYDTASVINDVMNMTMGRAVQKNLDYNISVDEALPRRLRGDEIRLRQVMLNIINNAIKYTDKGSVNISVSARDVSEDGLVLVISVADTGIGIREEDMDRLFKSFQRLDQQKNRNVEGTGLGLHITYRLVELMQGKTEVESTYGQGSTFTLSIPQKIADREPVGDFSRAVSRYTKDIRAEETTLYAPDARVLVVDDNEMNLEVIANLLRDTKLKLDLAGSGQRCIELAEKNRYDCILLDQMMPGMNGEMTLKELEKLDIPAGTPVIALTADAIVGAKENYIAMGFTDYLSKPVKYEKLESMLKTYLPAEKQLARPEPDTELPVALIWGNDPEDIRFEKERLDGIYKCVCVTGSRAMEKYMEKHAADIVIHVTGRQDRAGR